MPPALPRELRLLVVEQNTIVALDVEDTLLRNGAAHVAVANTAAEALQCLDGTTFDAALVDLGLGNGDSREVAVRLEELRIPFAFAIGYGERADVPAPFEERAVIRKPYNEGYLLSRLAKLLSDAC